MKLNHSSYIFLPFIFFFVLGSYSFVSTFDTLENYLPIYKYLFSNHIHGDFLIAINSGEPYLAYGWYPWLQIFFFKNFSLSISYQIVLSILIFSVFFGNYLLFNNFFKLSYKINLILSFFSLLILLRTSSLDIAHLCIAHLILYLQFKILEEELFFKKAIFFLIIILLISGLVHIQYIPLLFLYIFLISIFFYKNFLKIILINISSFLFILLIRFPELFSIYQNISNSGRSISNMEIAISYIFLEHLFPVIDLYFIELRSFFYIFLFIALIFSIFYNSNSKIKFKIIFLFLLFFSIPIFNFLFIDVTPLFNKLRFYSLLSFFPNLVLFLSASRIFILEKYLSISQIKFTFIFFLSLFILHILMFNFNHLINWLYHGNLKNISSNEQIIKIKNTNTSDFRVATYGYFSNFPLYYNFETVNGYVPVSNQSSKKLWKNINKKALTKFPELNSEFKTSFNNNSFVFINKNKGDFIFEDIFDLDLLGDRNVRYIFSRVKINSNLLNIIYEPKIDAKSLISKFTNLLNSNFSYHNFFYIYELKNYKNRFFFAENNNTNNSEKVTYRYLDNKYLIYLPNKSSDKLIVNHFYDDNWLCKNEESSENLHIEPYKNFFFSVYLNGSKKISCKYG